VTLAAELDADLAARLRRRGQRVTSQRLVIHRALRELGRHATAEEVLESVRDRLPGVSLPTVYATLELLEELDVVRRVSRAPHAALYDPRPDPHHHLVCIRCGRIEDFEVDLELAPAVQAAHAAGYRRPRGELVVSGLCADCAGG
jgi:Fe2+ or Zn2+ uptake regulation protein